MIAVRACICLQARTTLLNLARIGTEKLKTTLIKATGMNTAQCVRLLTNAIQDLPGAASVEHGSMVSEQDIRQAIVGAGFDAS